MEERQTYHHKNLRNAIIEKGIELVDKEGVNNLSIRKVAVACGVSHGAPYFHFKNKEELLIAMQQHITEQFACALEKSIAEHIGQSEIIMHLGLAYVNFFLEKPAYFCFLYSQSNFPINLSPEDGHQGFKPYEIYKKVLVEFLNRTTCPKEKYEDIVLALLAAVHGITALATMKNINYKDNWKDKVIDLIQVFTLPYKEEKV